MQNLVPFNSLLSFQGPGQVSPLSPSVAIAAPCVILSKGGLKDLDS